MKSLQRQQGLCPGFTLIELLVVIAIIGLLAALLFPVFGRAREQARASACMSNLKQIGMAMELYVHDYDDIYPMSRFPDALHPAGGCTSPNNNVQPDDDLEGSSVNWKRAILSYVKNQGVWACPSNAHVWDAGGYNGKQNFGDETNVFYTNTSQWLPISYAYNGSFFHEAIAPCWLGEKVVRGRYRAEIQGVSNLILLMETRLSYPDLGDWWLPRRINKTDGPFQTHNGGCNWLFADQHMKHLKPQATCASEMWTDGLPSVTKGCDHLDQIAAEYR
jgi:prepilin-type N-terminal cleavage/methylation domain-containing protein/prepilin-type processing-associated H-X9-DG protein